MEINQQDSRESTTGLWAIVVVILVLIIVGFLVFFRPEAAEDGDVNLDLNLSPEESGSTDSTN